MSKTIRKTTTSKNNDIVNNEKSLAKLQAEENAKREETKPYGTEPGTGAQLSGRTVFDALDEAQSTTQLAGYRALANSAIFGACLQALDMVDDERRANEANDQDVADRQEQARQRLNTQVKLYNYACYAMAPFVQSQYDEAMTAEAALDFISTNNRALQSREMSDETLDAYGLTREDYKHARAVAAQRQKERDAATRQRMRDHRAEVLEAVNTRLSGQLDEQYIHELLNSFTADQHVRMYTKVLTKLRARAADLLVRSENFNGEMSMQLKSDAGVIATDAKFIDAAYVAFARANANELRLAA